MNIDNEKVKIKKDEHIKVKIEEVKSKKVGYKKIENKKVELEESFFDLIIIDLFTSLNNCNNNEAIFICFVKTVTSAKMMI